MFYLIHNRQTFRKLLQAILHYSRIQQIMSKQINLSLIKNSQTKKMKTKKKTLIILKMLLIQMEIKQESCHLQRNNIEVIPLKILLSTQDPDQLNLISYYNLKILHQKERTVHILKKEIQIVSTNIFMIFQGDKLIQKICLCSRKFPRNEIIKLSYQFRVNIYQLKYNYFNISIYI